MKFVSRFLFTAFLATGLCAAVGQDAPKPPAGGPVPASPPGTPTSSAPAASPSPTPEGRHHGERHAEGWHHFGGPWEKPAEPPKPTSYIGVITAPPPAVLSAQLGLVEGFGLVVADVLPESPAAAAGIQRYDVLTKFNDQQLVDSAQFAALVRALPKDSAATVTLLRKAAEQTVSVKIGERVLPPRTHTFPVPGNYRTGGAGYGPEDFDRQGDPVQSSRRMQEDARRIQERAQAYSEKMHEYRERMKAWQKNPSAQMPPLPEPPPADGGAATGRTSAGDGGPPIPPEEILREARPGGAAQIRLVQPNATVTYHMENAKLVMKDDTGDIEMNTHDGKRSLIAHNAQGETLFDGPIDTEDQRKALPEDVRKKLETLERQRQLAETPRPAPGNPLNEPDVQ